MAIICYYCKCTKCPYFGIDEDKGIKACNIRTNENIYKICQIIDDIMTAEVNDDPELSSMAIYISTIMAFGYKYGEIEVVAKIMNIEIDPDESDPDDESDNYGSLIITMSNWCNVVDLIKKHIHK